MSRKSDRPYVRVSRWHQTAHRPETNRVPAGEVIYGVLVESGDRDAFDVIPTAAGLAAMAVVDNNAGGSDGRGWAFDAGDSVTRITYDELPDEAVTAMAAEILLDKGGG